MTTQSIVNAAPLHLMFGTEDVSTRAIELAPLEMPAHLPKFYGFAKRGPSTPQLVVGGSRTLIYGDESFTIGSKWFSHTTLYSNEVNAAGNAQMFERLIPADAGPVANLLLSLELLKDMIDDYERNPDGSLKLDAQEKPIPLATKIEGYRGVWHVTHITDIADVGKFGNAPKKAGLLTGIDKDGAATTSQIYPWMEFRASSIGDDGNNTGVRIWAPTINSNSAFDSRIMATGKQYAFRMSVMRRQDQYSTGTPVTSKSGEKNVLVTLKPQGVNPVTGMNFDVNTNFINSYQNVNDPAYPTQLGDFGQLNMYQGNISEVLGLLFAAEKQYLVDNPAAMGDIAITDNDEARYKMNVWGATNYDATPYHTFQLDKTNGIVMSEYTQQYNQGGDDGTMDDATLDKMVAEKIQEYADPNSRLQSMALNVENTFYDSGFTRETKLKLTSFIARRKDTFLWLSTHEHGKIRKSASEESSMAIGLRTQAQLFPESDYYGTPVMRCAIMGRVGKLRSSLWVDDVSPLLEVCGKMSAYMGRGDGKWRAGGNFSRAPGSVLTRIYDVNENYTPATQRNRDWENGLNWVEAFDMQSNSIPALKTVYTNDTSVLTSVLTVYAICNLERIADQAWIQFRGSDDLTRQQLKERVEAFVYQRIENKFDNRYQVVPEVFFTDADIARGYSWQLRNNIYANNMLTVQTSHVRAHRMDDFVAPR
jgi:hypothetical protein